MDERTATTARRPRDLDWPRASALLYGDWGTSKAYVIGLAFAAAGYGSFPIILAVCGLTALVGVNYMIVCRCFPDGGGVYSAAREHGRVLAVIGALLLVADLTVTAALSGWAALSYLGVPTPLIGIVTAGCVVAVGVLNFFGPRHSGSLAVMLALPTVIVVVGLILLSGPELTMANLEPAHENFGQFWVAFVGVILALSGVEAVANLTGTMKPDRGSPPDQPRVGRNAFKAILPVALEVTVGTALLGWAMLSLPHTLTGEMTARQDDMLRFIGEHYAGLLFGSAAGQIVGWVVGVIFALLLLSAVNTAIAALTGLLFTMARDGEMPAVFARLNRFGVPTAPLVVAVVIPVVILFATDNFNDLAGLYAIGVVGAICVNLGSCALNKNLPLHWAERGLMGVTFLLLAAVEVTLAKTKPDALFFVSCVLILGFLLRAWSQRRSGMTTVTLPAAVASLVDPQVLAALRAPPPDAPRILLGLNAITPVLRYAVDEARLRGAALYVLYVREVAVLYHGRPQLTLRWQNDPRAAAVLGAAIKLAHEAGVSVVPVFASSRVPPAIIVETACTLGVDFVILGASQRGRLGTLLKGDLVAEVARDLPDTIELVIHG